MRLLYVGSLGWGGGCLSRLDALRCVADSAYAVDLRTSQGEYAFRTTWQRAQMRVCWTPLRRRIEQELVREARRYRPDCIWIDQGVMVGAAALQALKDELRCVLVHYTPDSLDSPGMGASEFREALGVYDMCITTKRRDIPTYLLLGARNVTHTFQGFDPNIHRPLELSVKQLRRFGSDVVFVGQRMTARATLIANLAHTLNCNIVLFGRHWERGRTGEVLGPLQRGWVFGDDYARALCGSKIALGMLNQKVHDEHTSRTFEIPASRTLMLAERTEAHQECFEEDKEAVYFGSEDEFIDKTRYYLAHPDEAKRIATAGFLRACSGYAWKDRMLRFHQMIQKVLCA